MKRYNVGNALLSVRVTKEINIMLDLAHFMGADGIILVQLFYL